MVRVQMVCQFGAPVRGLSPYGDALREALMHAPDIKLDAVDYQQAYPSLLHPAERGGAQGRGELHWARPWTWRRVARRPAAVMHIQHWAAPLSVYLWPLAAMAKRNRKHVVMTVHNPRTHERMRLFRFFENRLLRQADVLIVHGHTAREHLLHRLGKRSPEVRVVAHGMKLLHKPAKATDQDHVRLGLTSEHRYILLFGNLRGYKGVDLLLSAWSRVRGELPDVRLVVAGRFWGGSKGRLGRLMARLLGTAGDADRIRAVMNGRGISQGVVLREGFQEDDDIDALIRISALTVFPYRRFSGQSGAACRAAAMGRPVLVSQVGALSDLSIDDSWTLIPGDEGELARRLVEKMRDPSVAMRARAEQLKAIQACDWQNVAQVHAVIYRELA